jgi:hypothetical protein
MARERREMKFVHPAQVVMIVRPLAPFSTSMVQVVA